MIVGASILSVLLVGLLIGFEELKCEILSSLHKTAIILHYYRR